MKMIDVDDEGRDVIVSSLPETKREVELLDEFLPVRERMRLGGRLWRRGVGGQ